MTAEAPPRPRLPEIPGPWETAVRAWRVLRRMSTALVLLFTLAAASILATFVPQRPLVPTTVEEWIAGQAGPGAVVSTAFDWLDLFDVFGSVWFGVLVALLFTSLTGCLIPRWRGFLRTLRKPPPAGRNLERLTHSVELRTTLAPEQALAAAAPVLRGFRRRMVAPADTASGRPQLAAERGRAREAGSLVFHSAFYLLLLGALIGKAFGFEGQINIPEGSAFADTRIAYDLARPGRYFGLDDHRGFVVRLDDFDVRYYANQVPRDFVSRVTVIEDGREVRRGVTRVNHPLRHDGMKLYQVRFGMAPHIRVRAGDTVLFDEAVMLADAGGGVWTGAAKVSLGARTGETRGPQIALDLVFLPDAAVNGDGVPYSRSPEPRNPRLIAELYVGDDLGLERPAPAARFDRAAGQVLGPPAILPPGGEAALAGGTLALEFAELRTWSGFQVSHAPGRLLLLAAAILLLGGLLPSLYSARRRVWLEARPDGDRTTVVLAGVALQRKPAFVDEFARISAAVRTALEDPA